MSINRHTGLPIDGSLRRALSTDPPFTVLRGFELRPNRAASLKRRVGRLHLVGTYVSFPATFTSRCGWSWTRSPTSEHTFEKPLPPVRWSPSASRDRPGDEPPDRCTRRDRAEVAPGTIDRSGCGVSSYINHKHRAGNARCKPGAKKIKPDPAFLSKCVQLPSET